jgi:hypothetical protein
MSESLHKLVATVALHQLQKVSRQRLLEDLRLVSQLISRTSVVQLCSEVQSPRKIILAAHIIGGQKYVTSL